MLSFYAYQLHLASADSVLGELGFISGVKYTPRIPTILLGHNRFTNQRFDALVINPFLVSVTVGSNASVGFDTFSGEAMIPKRDVPLWLNNVLGRSIHVYDPHTSECWYGFINNIVIRTGAREITLGPLLELANSSQGSFTNYFTGAEQKTLLISDQDSIDRYGTFFKPLNVGKATLAMANYMTNSYLADSKDPQLSPNVNLEGGETSLSFEALGFGHALKAYDYSNRGSGNTTAATVIQAVLAAHPDSLFSADYTEITANSVQVPVRRDTEAADSTIESIVRLGYETGAKRMVFGVFEDARGYYFPIPDNVVYMVSSSGNLQFIGGDDVSPWNIRPGQWILLPDAPGGMIDFTNLRNNPNVAFIESVSFSFPGFLPSISGGKVDTISQKLARLGGY